MARDVFVSLFQRMDFYQRVKSWGKELIWGWLSSKESTCNAGDAEMHLIPAMGRYPAGGSGNPFQYACLENPTDRGAWKATVYRVTKSRTPLSD